METLNIAFCFNCNMLLGFIGTIVSLLKNCSKKELIKIHIVSDINEKNRDWIREFLSEYIAHEKIKFYKEEKSQFIELKPLLGDFVTYQRLLLPNLLNDVTKILYLDSDLFFYNFDVCLLFNTELKNHPFAAGATGKMVNDLDWKFYNSLGYCPDDVCFNAGVLLLNGDMWRKDGLLTKCLKFGQDNYSHLRSADQTILNSLFSRSFFPLENSFHRLIPPHINPEINSSKSEILHFYGSPKPWDFFGRWVTAGGKTWWTEFKKLRISRRLHLLNFSREMLFREFSIRRSYARTIIRRIKKT
jgi:lipopolysaccharide biosynthesis glycosyltransferase